MNPSLLKVAVIVCCYQIVRALNSGLGINSTSSMTNLTITANMSKPDIEVTYNDFFVQVRRQSGLISMLRMNKNKIQEKVLNIKLDAIYEVDSAGKKINEKDHFITAFDNQYFNISISSTTIRYGLSVKLFNFTSFLGFASVTVEFMIFTSSGNITVESGESFYVKAGTMKFNVAIKDWIFCGMANASCKKGVVGSYLDVQLEVRAENDGQEAKEPQISGEIKGRKSPRSKYNQISYDVGVSSATFSTMVLTNGNWTDMPAGFPRYELQESKKIFIIRFLLSTSEMKYDPIIELQSSSDINSSLVLEAQPTNVSTTVFNSTNASTIFFNSTTTSPQYPTTTLFGVTLNNNSKLSNAPANLKSNIATMALSLGVFYISKM